MNKIKDITYEVLEYDNTYGSTTLELNIEGDDINCVVINTIRRAILSYVPNYAYTNFSFSKNNTIFNNNYLKLKIINIPVWGIENNLEIFTKQNKSNDNKKIIDNINDKIIQDNEDEDNINDNIDLNDTTNIPINSSSLKQLTMFVDVSSDKKDILTVTTDHAKFYYAEKKIDSPYKIPIPLIKLQPNQTITFSVITSVGTEQSNAIFSVVAACYYNEISDNKFKFIIESRGTINEKRIIHVALINLIDKLKCFMLNLPDTIDDTKNKGEIIISNEDSTLGNLISYGLQKHKHIKFAGYNIPHPLEEKVKLHYELNKGIIKDILEEVVNYFIKLFEKISELNNKIKLK
jgi:DNA-directed RNA polymerase subunit L